MMMEALVLLVLRLAEWIPPSRQWQGCQRGGGRLYHCSLVKMTRQIVAGDDRHVHV
jgi:hypothetical protein